MPSNVIRPTEAVRAADEIACLADIAKRGAARWPERLALADAAGELTYAVWAEQCARTGAWLARQGVRPGDRVAVRLPNSVRFAVAHFGALWAGAVSVPLEPGLPPEPLANILDRAGARVCLDETSPWDEILVTAPLDSPVPRADADLAALMFTTGTTGRPKGVMLTQGNVRAALRNIVGFLGYTEADREVITLPLSHNFGLGHLYCNLLAGGAVYLEPGLARVGRVLKVIESFGATGFPTTPFGVALLLDRYGEVFAKRARGLRFMVVNSAPLPPERTAQLQALLPELGILVYYGLTEASRSTFLSLTVAGPERYRSVGPPMPGVELTLDSSGEILIGGPTVTPGYWGEPELTAEKLVGGRLHTGDLGRLDAGGNLYVEGRRDDVINLGGHKVNPLEVERVIERFPGVRECAVAGVDAVRAFIVADGELDETALTHHCRELLPAYAVPTEYHRRDSLPRGATGKLQRQALR